MAKQTYPTKLLPSSIITEAVLGDSLAMTAVLDHYQSYIISLSLRNLYLDNSNEPSIIVDDFTRRQLETKLIEKVLTFDVTR